jgi:hypothetical protein
MAMCLWFPWLQRMQPQDGTSKSFSRRSKGNNSHEAISSGPPQSNPTIEKLDNLQVVVEKISRSFNVTDDDVQRITLGFVTQLG